MPSHRTLRVAEAIREVVSQAILFEMADPRAKGITVIRAEVTSDLREATVFVSIMGTDSQQKRSLASLQHAAGFLQSKVAARLQTRYTPILSFKIDEGVKKSIAISRLIDEAIASDRRDEAEPPDDPAEDQESDPAAERP